MSRLLSALKVSEAISPDSQNFKQKTAQRGAEVQTIRLTQWISQPSAIAELKRELRVYNPQLAAMDENHK